MFHPPTIRSLSALLVAACWAAPAAAEDVKHIILFIGDGMHAHHEVATSRYLHGKDFGLSFHALPYQGNVSTWDVTTYNKYAATRAMPAYSQNAIIPVIGYDPSMGGSQPSPLQTTGIDFNYFSMAGKWFATDSASSATAWTTGFKTEDGNLAWKPGDLPDGKLETIAETLRRQRGFSIGVVSTVPFTHATPAAHVSHNTSRNNYGAIATEILKEVKPEVVIGGGHPGWGGSYIPKSLYSEFVDGLHASDYVFVERVKGANGATALSQAAAQAQSSKRRLFGLFGGNGGNFESPLPVDAPGKPAITRATLENPLLSETIAPALNVLGADPDGFFVLFEQGDVDWAAHDNNFNRIVGTTWDLDVAVKTAIEYIDKPGDGITWENTLLIVTADHGNSYLRLTPGQAMGAGELPAKDSGKISFSTGTHTNELVRLYARGAGTNLISKNYEGKWYPCTKIIDNTQLYHLMLEAAGVVVPSPLVPQKIFLSCTAATMVSAQ
jgi:alkaline phosphatase